MASNSLARFISDRVSKAAPKHLTKDMLGQVVGHITVTARAASLGTGARWRCTCGLCGSSLVITGRVLRSAQERGATDYACEQCKPRRGGRKDE